MAERTASELVEFLAKAIVTNPEDIRVREIEGRELELETAQEDRGRVIGRQGRVAKALRSILSASRPGRQHRLEIVD
jgi:predicted RNA-binding protein YlqC (UPF0109 family)